MPAANKTAAKNRRGGKASARVPTNVPRIRKSLGLYKLGSDPKDLK